MNRTPALRVKRIYDPATTADGYRILVDRLWPRGVARKKANIEEWLKDIAPSTELRDWFAHRPERWQEFVTRYRAELATPAREADLRHLREQAKTGVVTLLYAAKDEARNNAVVLRDLLLDSPVT